MKKVVINESGIQVIGGKLKIVEKQEKGMINNGE